MDKAREAGAMESYASDSHSIASSDVPPPAYRAVASANALKVAKLAAMTLITMTFMVGVIVLMGVYIKSNSLDSCPCLAAETLPGPQGLRRGPSSGIELEGSPSSSKSTKVPFNFDLDTETGNMLKNNNNKKANVNCVVERKKATQIITHEPKMIVTPFGNLTSDPRLTHIVGEKMIFTCNTGKKNDKKGNRIKRSTGMCSCNCAC